MIKLHIPPIWILFFVTLLDLIGFGIVIPLLPALFTDTQSPYSVLRPGMSLQQGYILFGVLLAIYPFFQFFTAPIWGQLSDRHGRKRLLAATMVAMAFSNALFAFGLIVKSIPLLLISKALAGASGGNLSISQAIVADLYSPKVRARKFGVIAAAFGIGMMLGPYLGGKLVDSSVVSWFSIETPFVATTILSLLSALSIIFFLPETIRQKEDLDIHWLRSIANVARAYELTRMRTIFAVGFLFQASFAFFASFINVYLYQEYRFNEGQIGEFFGFVGIWIALTQLVISRFVYGRFSNRTIILTSLFVYATSILMLFFISNIWALLINAAIFAIANALAQISILAQVSAQAGITTQGKILGLNASIYALAQMIPPLLAGFVAASFQSDTPIILSCIVAFMSFTVYALARKKTYK